MNVLTVFIILVISLGLIPNCVVLVATVRAIKMHGGGPKVRECVTILYLNVYFFDKTNIEIQYIYIYIYITADETVWAYWASSVQC